MRTEVKNDIYGILKDKSLSQAEKIRLIKDLYDKAIKLSNNSTNNSKKSK